MSREHYNTIPGLWRTNTKTEGVFNLGWLDEESERKEKQIAHNQQQAKQMNKKTVKFEPLGDFKFDESLDKALSLDQGAKQTLYWDDASGYHLVAEHLMYPLSQTYRFTMLTQNGTAVDSEDVAYYDYSRARRVVKRMIDEQSTRLQRDFDWENSSAYDAEDPFKGAFGKREPAKTDYEKEQNVIDKVYHLSGRPPGVNPNRYSSEAYDELRKQGRRSNWSNNCALCTVATIMQLKGYSDVEAGLQPEESWGDSKQHIDALDIWELDASDPNNYILPGSTARKQFQDLRRYVQKNLELSLAKSYVNTEGSVAMRATRDADALMSKNKMPVGAERAAKAIYDKVKSWGKGAYGEISVIWNGKGGQRKGSGHSMLVYWDHEDDRVAVFCPQSGKVYYDLSYLLHFTDATKTEIVRWDNATKLTAKGRKLAEKGLLRKGGKELYK